MKRGLTLLCAGSVLAGCGGDNGMMPIGAGTPCVEPAPGYAPADVFCTGLYLNRDSTLYATDVQPYLPGYTLWSDGAEKHRYLYLPPGSTIDTTNMDEWRFPLGTKAWKEFRLDGALVETRLLWKQSDADWVTATYIWDAAGTSATLNTSHSATLTAAGYEIPNQKNCDKCHAGAADKLLGVEAILLALPKAEGVTLTSLAQAGALSAPPAMTTVALPDDASGKAADVLGYLHANCGAACHSLRGLADQTSVFMRLRAEQFFPAAGAEPVPPLLLEQTDMFQSTIGQPVRIATFAETFPEDTAIITAGDHDRSLLWRVANTRGKNQMPPIVSHKIDPAGTAALAAWIDALSPAP